MGHDIFGQKTAIVPFANDNKVRLTISELSTNDKIFLTGVKGSMSPNYQLQYSVGAGRYVNSFTHRLSMFVISGKYVLADCNGSLDSITNPAFYKFYEARNISNSDKPVRIAYSGLVITGYLVLLELGQMNQEAVDGFPFTMHFLGSVDGLTNRPAVTQIAAAVAAYTEAFTLQPGKTGPNRSAEATVDNAVAVSATSITPNVTSLTDREIRNQQRFA